MAHLSEICSRGACTKDGVLIEVVESASSARYDADILFNPLSWNECAKSQEGLFRFDALERISRRITEEFYFGHAPNRQMPEISKDDWNTSLLEPYTTGPSGYDLPCLLSANRPTKGRMMLCAQDPLRGAGPATLTVGTFFGIDSNYHRSRRHWGLIWQLVRDCVAAGYDVWVTDAVKLYAGKDVVLNDKGLRDLCFAIMRDEVSAFRPDKVIAFGAWAQRALSEASVTAPVVRVPHPTARGLTGTMQSRLESYRGFVLS